VVADAVVVRGQQQLGPAVGGVAPPAVQVRRGYVEPADRRVAGQPAGVRLGGVVDGGVDRRVEGQDRQGARLRSGEHRVLPAAGVHAAADEQPERAVGVAVGVEQGHPGRYHHPLAGRVARPGDGEGASADQRLIR
jgi:hypothetical protein